jgi:hypothetical protein
MITIWSMSERWQASAIPRFTRFAALKWGGDDHGDLPDAIAGRGQHLPLVVLSILPISPSAG